MVNFFISTSSPYSVSTNFAIGNVTDKADGLGNIYAGGIVDGANQGRIFDNVAAGSSVILVSSSGTYRNVYRIWGYSAAASSDRTNNYANSAMQVGTSTYTDTPSYSTPSSTNSGHQNGMDVTAANLRTSAFWLRTAQGGGPNFPGLSVGSA